MSQIETEETVGAPGLSVTPVRTGRRHSLFSSTDGGPDVFPEAGPTPIHLQRSRKRIPSENPSRNWRPKNPTEVLPIGVSIVSDAQASESKPKQYGVGVPTKPERVWYIVYIELTPTIQVVAGREFSTHSMRRCWDFAYTKREAIRIAQRLDGAGHQVTDIFRGTKTHISNKYEGLRYIRNKGAKNE